MTADELISASKQLLGKGKLKECFILLDKNISKATDCEVYNTILLIQGRYENAQRSIRRGLSTEDSPTVHAINAHLLGEINEIRNEHIAEPYLDLKSSRVLIICLNDSDEFYMRAFCSRMSIPNYEVKQLKEYEEPTEYDFIVFDNHSIKSDEKNYLGLRDEEITHLKLMEEYIEEYNEHKKYMIHFGDNSQVVTDNRDVIYAGNSKFALFSRIQEMIQYIGKDRLYKK
jgi:hypothetical protein